MASSQGSLGEDVPVSDTPTNCPSCDVDITAMSAEEFRDHTKQEHPEMYDLIRSALARLR